MGLLLRGVHVIGIGPERLSRAIADETTDTVTTVLLQSSGVAGQVAAVLPTTHHAAPT